MPVDSVGSPALALMIAVPAAATVPVSVGAALTAMLPPVIVNPPDVTVSVWLPAVSSVTPLSVRTPATKLPAVGESRLPISESPIVAAPLYPVTMLSYSSSARTDTANGCRRSQCPARRA